MKTLIITISMLFIAAISLAQSTVSINDFEILNNTNWKGTLTYLDYQSGKTVPVSTTMQIGVTDKAIEQDIQYTWEPNKNVRTKTKIKKNGRYLGKQKVISKIIKEDGTVILLTSYEGKDDNKKATMFFTYEFNNNNYKVTKEVQFDGSNERFMRNNYNYKKNLVK